jgi:predicted GIY-YIG superfamily endonuclease
VGKTPAFTDLAYGLLIILSTTVANSITYEHQSLKKYKRGSWYLYVIRTDTPWNPYIGITSDPVRRFREHIEGKGSDVARKFGVRYMHVVARYPSYRSARTAEKEIHNELGVTRAKPSALS